MNCHLLPKLHGDCPDFSKSARENGTAPLPATILTLLLVILLGLPTFVVSQEIAADEPIDYGAIAVELTDDSDDDVSVQEPQPDPSQGDFPNTFAPRRRNPNDVQIDPAVKENAHRRRLEEMQREFLRQKERGAAEERRAQEEARRAEQEMPNRLQMERDALRQQVEMLRTQLAELSKFHQQSLAGPLPENAETKVFSLRHAKAAGMTRVLNEILGGRNLRMGVDERSNSLIVSADDKTIAIVEALLMKLDATTAAPTRASAPTESLQLRIVWLLDGLPEGQGKRPTANIVSPQVISALQELGFENPRVVCQQGTTLTLGPDNRRGDFRFAIPVLINSERWQFQGQGLIEPMANDRFNLQFEMRFNQVNAPDGPFGRGGRGNSMEGQLGGSIYTPLGHYTVMGTTTFVGSSTPMNDPAMGEGTMGVEMPSQQQHLSAFVVYLDRAREYSAAKAEEESRKPKATTSDPADDPFGL